VNEFTDCFSAVADPPARAMRPDLSQYEQLTPEQKAEVDAVSTAVWHIPPPYDELLEARVRQLKEIDERIERIMGSVRSWRGFTDEFRQLRLDIAHMIQTAEHEAARF